MQTCPVQQVEFASETFHSSVCSVYLVLSRLDVTSGQLFTICARKRTVHFVKIAIINDDAILKVRFAPAIVGR